MSKYHRIPNDPEPEGVQMNPQRRVLSMMQPSRPTASAPGPSYYVTNHPLSPNFFSPLFTHPIPPPPSISEFGVNSGRFIDRDGELHQSSGKIYVRKRIQQIHWWALYQLDWFHSLVDAPTLRVVCVLLTMYVFIVLFYTLIYYEISVHAYCALDFDGSWISAFDFSLETMATVGYSTSDIFFDQCVIMSVVLLSQVLVGLLVDAIVIGIIYCRIARPHARASTIIFSKHAVVRRIRGKLYFVCQLVELRKHQLVASHIRLYALRHEPSISGTLQSISQVAGYDAVSLQTCPMSIQSPAEGSSLSAGNSSMLLLMLPQVVIHELTMNSPLYPPPTWIRRRREQQQLLVQSTGQQVVGAYQQQDNRTQQIQNKVIMHWTPPAYLPLLKKRDGLVMVDEETRTANALSNHCHNGHSQNDSGDRLFSIQPSSSTEMLYSPGLKKYYDYMTSSSSGNSNQNDEVKELAGAEEEEEPLWQREEREMIMAYLADREVEILALVEGTDSATGGSVQARHSYLYNELQWNHSFAPCLYQDPRDQVITIDFDHFHMTEEVSYDAVDGGTALGVAI